MLYQWLFGIAVPRMMFCDAFCITNHMQLSVLHIARISLSISRYYHFNGPLRDPPGLLKVREVKNGMLNY